MHYYLWDHFKAIKFGWEYLQIWVLYVSVKVNSLCMPQVVMNLNVWIISFQDRFVFSILLVTPWINTFSYHFYGLKNVFYNQEVLFGKSIPFVTIIVHLFQGMLNDSIMLILSLVD